MADFCKACKHCDTGEYDEPCFSCRNTGGGIPTKWEAKVNCKPQTNADRIRAMSDEELARFFFADKIGNEYILSQKRLGYSEHTLTATQIEAIRHNCYCIWMRYLKQPAETPTENADRCVCCGEIIPEGRQVCPNCLVAVKKGREKNA